MHPNDTTRCPTCGGFLNAESICKRCTSDPKIIEYKQLLEQGLKRCNSCDQVLPLSEFQKRPERKSGLKPHCKKCATAKHKAYVEKNTERMKAYDEQYKERKQSLERERYQSNRPAKDAKSRQWARLHPDKIRERRRRWARANPNKVRVHAAQTRARRIGLPAIFSVADWEHAVEYWQGHCAYCGNQEGLLRGTRLSAEHFIPLSLPESPGSTPANIIPICRSCNERRRRQDVRKWLTKTFGARHADQRLAKIAMYFELVRASQSK